MIRTIVIQAVTCIYISRSSDVSVKIAELAESLCVGVVDMDRIDPTDADISNAFVGPENYLESIIYDTECGDIASCFQKYQTRIIQSLLRTGTRKSPYPQNHFPRNRSYIRHPNYTILHPSCPVRLLSVLSEVRAMVLLLGEVHCS